ncbi:MAG: PDZ domain-containing protein [Candidatus Niyogibacteria bacterium]|nr:PDZ domain-containing protein [Candidatus Niyogibacteria bacterium]
MRRRIVFAALVFAMFTVPACAAESASDDGIQAFTDLMTTVEQESYYGPTPKEMRDFSACMLGRAFTRFELEKGELKADITLESCFPKDKYMRYESQREFERRSAGSFTGIGVQIGSVSEGVLVVEVIAGGPAEKAGAPRKGDIITASGVKPDAMESLAGLPMADVVDRITGPDGSTVYLEILRDGQKLPLFAIVRGVVKVPSVEIRELGNGIVYLKLFSFDKANLIGDDLKQPFKDFSQKGLHTLVLDLRDNPGGFVHVAVQFLAVFAPQKGALLFESRDRHDVADQRYEAGGRGPYADWTIVVLVNEHSASASEVVSGGLQYWGHTVIGKKTFGKGSMQAAKALADGGMLWLTTRHYFIGGGTSPEGVGITPDVEIADDPATPEDEVLEKAKEIIRQKQK